MLEMAPALDNKNNAELIYDIKGMKIYYSRDLEFDRLGVGIL